MNITFFFRKPSPEYHSIEKLFFAMLEHLPNGWFNKHFSPYPSKGIVKRLLIGIDARKSQGDINHITGDIHFIAMFLKKEKTILTIHDIGHIKKGNSIKRALLRYFWFTLPIKSVKLVTVISEFTKKELVEYLNIEADKIIVINNCIPDIYKFHPMKVNTAKPVILQIGTKSNKNLERLIEAVKDIDCKLVIVGKLSEIQVKLLKDKKTEYENHFNISENEMLNLFVNCNLLAYVSTYEGFGMPVVEANAVGRPVLASNIEPIKSVASDAALLVDPFEISAIRNGIIRLLKDNNLCKELIEKGLKNAGKYTAETVAKQYLSVYERLTY